MESKDISLTIIGVFTILALLAVFYMGITKKINFRFRLATSMKFFIAFVVFVLLAGFDFASELKGSFIVIAIACGVGCIWNAIMHND